MPLENLRPQKEIPFDLLISFATDCALARIGVASVEWREAYLEKRLVCDRHQSARFL